MVSPAPSAPQNPPVLSYADRAKKARNANSQPSSSTRPQSQLPPANPPPPTTASAALPVLNTAPDPGASLTPASGSANHRPSQQKASPSTSGDSELPVQDTPNDANLHNAKLPSPISEPPTKSAAPPKVNVWNLRKEQMAQARATSHTQAVPGSANSRTAQPQEASVSHAPDGPSSTNGSTTVASGSSQKPSINGNGIDTPQHGQKKSPTTQVSRAVPPVDDATSWPTVGTAAAGTLRPSGSEAAGSTDPRGGKADDQASKEEDKNGTANNAKKSEKPKWVPIPPEELQAAVDVYHPRSTPRSTGHSRTRSSQQQSQGRAAHNSKGASAGSTSGQNSQGQSRTQSAAGTRAPPSHTGSVSHSQAESRVGSVHSSPRQQSSRGGRRLPDEGSVPRAVNVGGSRNRSMRSSRAPSPQTAGRLVQVNDDRLLSVPAPDASNVALQLSTAMDHLRLHPDPGHVQSESFYPQLAPPLSATASQPHSYHSTHASNSPITGPYSLPSGASPAGMYSSPPSSLPGYAGAPPYAVYPYAYPGYGQQPYIQWTGPTPGQNPNLYAIPPQFQHTPSPSNQSGYSPASVPETNVSREAHSQEGIPPPTMISRPPPPGQSEGVAGYREVGFLSPSLAAHVAAEGSEPDATAFRGRQAREFSFGTVKRTVANKTPSPPPPSQPDVTQVDKAVDTPAHESIDQAGETGEKSFPVFSIGLNPGEVGPARIRSKTHPKSATTSHERGSTAPARLGPSHSQTSAEESELSAAPADAVVPEVIVKVIDLTDAVAPTWEFGTTNQAGDEESRSAEFTPGAAPLPNSQPNGGIHVFQDTQSAQDSTAAPTDTTASLSSIPRPPSYVPRMQVPPLSVGLPNGLPPPAHSPSSGYPYSGVSMVSPSVEPRSSDEWEVKNYGYGFGRGNNGPGLAPQPGRLERDRDYSPREYNPGRPRRGSYGSGFGYDRGSGHERGGYTGRRGRGINGGFGGRAYGGRNASRGAYQQGQPSRPPFSVTQQPVTGPTEPGYYVTPPPQGTTYFHPLGYEYGAYPYVPVPVTAPTPTQTTSPPVPTPQSQLNFPLDPTRYYLLGQLEYYLSAQNLAQDFYLRQRMDSRGWISIPLIASFNRIKQLTMDLQLVRDVLTLSSLVEVKDDFVRVRVWEQYVLPNAAPSMVMEDGFTYQSYAHPEFEETVSSTSESAGHDSTTSHDGEEEDYSEEEVEFVMGKEAQGSWTPERNTTAAATTS